MLQADSACRRIKWIIQITDKKNKGYLVWDVEQDELCKKLLVNCAKKKPAKCVKQFVCEGLGKPG